MYESATAAAVVVKECEILLSLSRGIGTIGAFMETVKLRAVLWNGAFSRALVLLGGGLCVSACCTHTRVQRCCFEKITTPSVVKPP